MHTRITTVGITLAGLLTLGTLVPTSSATAAVAPASQLNTCWSSDNGRPVVDSAVASPSVVDSDAGPTQVRITVQAHDTGGPGPATGIRRLVGTLVPAASSPGSWGGEYQSVELTRSDDGSWQGVVTVPERAQTTYALQVSAFDRAADDGVAADNSRYGQTFEDVLTATGRSFPDDTQAPVLEGLSLSAERVDTRKQARVVTVEATVTDDESGVRSVVLKAVSDGFGQDFTLSRVGDTDDYRGHATIKRWVGDQDAELVASLSDYAGNSVELHPADLEDRGYASHLKVVSGPRNLNPPRLVAVQRAPRSIDVRKHGRWYPVRVVLADPQGVRQARATLGYNPAADLHRISGNARRGVWAGRIWIPRCTYGPITTRLGLTVADGQGVHRGIHPRHVRVITIDNRSTSARVDKRNRDSWHANPLVFTFKRPVQGISTSNVSVLGYFHQSEITGVWSCRDRKGHRVDCVRGPVKQATFTVDDPEADFPGYVDWEPEHHLDVLDQLGNPVGSSFDPVWG